MKIKYWHIIPLLIFILSAYYLLSGSEILVKPLWYNPYIPFGTLITWFGLISLELLLYVVTNITISKTGLLNIIIRYSVLLLLILAILWVPIAYALSGNFAFNFSGSSELVGIEASKVFWYFSYILGGGAIFFFFVLALLLFFRPISKNN